MIRTNRSLWLAIIALGILVALPAGAAAQDKGAAGIWLASASDSPDGNRTWGRLSVKNGVLTFASSSMDWQRPLTDIKRVTESRVADRTIEIETLNGEVLLVSILGQQMITESPRKAMQFITRAVREAPAAARSAMAAAAAAGGGSSQ